MLDKLKLTLLSEKELTNYDKKLEVLDEYGIITPITDLAMLTGSYYGRQDNLKIFNCDLGPYRPRAGWFWLRSDDGNTKVIFHDGDIGNTYSDRRTRTIRPVLKVSKSFMADLIEYADYSDGVKTVLLGEYPQYVPDETIQRTLDELDSENLLDKTDRHYTFDGTDNHDFSVAFNPIICEEYVYNNRKFIKIKPNLDKYEQQFTFASGQKCLPDKEYYWVEVLPVEWLIDEKTKKLIAKEGLVGGIQFSHQKEYMGNFKGTDVYYYMNKYMINDLFQSMDLWFDYGKYHDSYFTNNCMIESSNETPYNKPHVKTKTRK